MTRPRRTYAWLLAAGTGANALALTPSTNEPHRIFEAAHRTVLIDAGSSTVTVDAAQLPHATQVIDAVELSGYLIVAQRDGVILVYKLPDPKTDAEPTFEQRIDNLGGEIQDLLVAVDVGRVLMLSAASTEIFGFRIHEQDVIDMGHVQEPAYFDHARFLDFLRDESGNTQTPRAFAVGAQRMALATDNEILEIFYLDRSYRVFDRAPLPEGIARIEAITHTGTHWLFAGLDSQAEPVLRASDNITGPWLDVGVQALDDALADEEGPIAWLPGGFTVTDHHVQLAIRGQRGAVASWSPSSRQLSTDTLNIRWLTPN